MGSGENLSVVTSTSDHEANAEPRASSVESYALENGDAGEEEDEEYGTGQ